MFSTALSKHSCNPVRALSKLVYDDWLHPPACLEKDEAQWIITAVSNDFTPSTTGTYCVVI